MESQKEFGNPASALQTLDHLFGKFCNLGAAWYEKGDYAKVIEYSERAIRLDPHFDRAYGNKVIVLMENGEHARALNFANKIHDLKQRNAHYARN